ncbi:hypothetical protein Ahy_B04g071550 isoform B [Arachis hypogaea]|uniref:Uncharacterized protein n=1 Tax=Arachis hypogaea TaxID=3818 RepID=A0A444ZL06_ARAHY|nr:hypothetical protein Ahy_B04g071550 isoform B [Arachis hypogaea]
MRIAQLESEKSSLLQKEVGLVEETKRLLCEKEILSLKVESLLEKINLLESDLSSFVEKEKSTKEDISNLNGKITMFQGQVAELEHFKNNLLLENQQLGENVSSLQTTIQNLENSSSFRSADASVKESASENEELKSQIEAACTLVEKLVLENAELVEKINMLYVELDRHNAEVGVSGGAGPDSINVFPHSDGVASDTTESAEVKSVSAQESGSLQETVMNDRDYINGEQAVGLTPNSSSLSDDTGEIVQIPLDDNEVHELEPQDAEIVEQDSVPLMDAPLIGAPFRLISFVAKYVSGEDLVVAAELELNPGCCLMYWSPEDLDCRPRKVLEMKRSFPWDEPDQNPDSSSNDIPLPIPSIDLTSQDILIRRAEMYQEYMKQIPIPSQRGSVIPFNSWMGLGKSMKQLYGQPLHYLTNVILKQWDQLRLNSKDEYKPLDNLIHPTKAEATIWLMEEVHRQTSSHFQIAELWKLDPMYNGSVDAIFPTLENAISMVKSKLICQSDGHIQPRLACSLSPVALIQFEYTLRAIHRQRGKSGGTIGCGGCLTLGLGELGLEDGAEFLPLSETREDEVT